MISAIIGTKVKQTQMFTSDGIRIPVTIVTAGPCVAVAMTGTAENRKTQLTYGISKSVTKPIEGHLKKAGIELKPRFLKEVSVPEGEEIAPGTEINVSQVFVEGDVVRVTGVSKGKGFAGVVKRHHFRGGPKTHGQSDRERAPGSIGQTTTPGRVYRGKRMAGRMGTDTVTVRNLKVVKVEGETNTLFIKGLVPGGKHALLMIRKEK